MGFEKFFVRADGETPKKEKEVVDHSKRRFLAGAGAFAVAAALPHESAAFEHTDVLPELEALTTFEAKERNIDKIFAYAAHLQLNEERLRTAQTEEEIESIIFANVPALEQGVLTDTELDFTNFMEEGGWPAVQFKRAENGTVHDSNSFSVNDLVISNRHVFGKVPGCESAVDGFDISGCDLDNAAVVPDAAARALRQERALSWKKEYAEESLHGRIVFIPSVHATTKGNREVLIPAVLVKITPNFLYQGKAGSFFGEIDSSAFKEELSESYIAVVAPIDADGNGVRNGWDIKGMSGSPVITLEDCSLGEKNVSGIVWGTLARDDERNNVTRSMIFIHGPKTIDRFLTQMGKNEPAAAPQKKSIAALIEEDARG